MLSRDWIVTTLVALSFAFGAVACASAQRPDPREEMSEAIDDFHTHLVWGRYEDAAGYLPPGQRAHFVGLYQEIGDNIEYTEFDVGVINMDPVSEEVSVTVTLHWLDQNTLTLKQTRIEETWALDPETEYWYIANRVALDD